MAEKVLLVSIYIIITDNNFHQDKSNMINLLTLVMKENLVIINIGIYGCKANYMLNLSLITQVFSNYQMVILQNYHKTKL